VGTVRTDKGMAALGTFEPALTVQFLPRCPGCAQPHPRARQVDSDECPDCGTFCPTGAPQVVPAALTGFAPWVLLARLFLWLARKLNNLAGSNRHGR
jgi:hypothetical protein